MSTVAATALSRFTPLRTRGARLLRLPSVRDDRGCLVWGEAGAQLPFEPTRFWSVFGVPVGQSRGNHAHRRLHELLVCLRGSCVVTLDDGAECDEVVLDDAELGLHVPPLVWGRQLRFSAVAVLLVLADERYRPEDYIRAYAEFMAVTARGG